MAEGGRLERRIHQKATGLYLLRELRGAFAGVTFVIAAILLAMLVSPSFRVAAGPETEWSIASHSFGWPAPALLFLVIFALPSVIAGPLVARLATNLLSLWIGLFCIALGCWWHIHLSTLGALVTRASMYGDGLVSVERLDGNWFSRWFINAEFYMLVRGGMLFAIIEFLLPFICAIGAMLMMNYWVKCWRGGEYYLTLSAHRCRRETHNFGSNGYIEGTSPWESPKSCLATVANTVPLKQGDDTGPGHDEEFKFHEANSWRLPVSGLR